MSPRFHFLMFLNPVLNRFSGSESEGILTISSGGGSGGGGSGGGGGK
jgi:hypothetical protein